MRAKNGLSRRWHRKGKANKIFIGYWKEGKSDCFLIKDKTSNKLHEKQHANVSICAGNTFYFGPTYVKQWRAFHEPLPCAFHATHRSTGPSFPSYCKHPQTAREGHPLAFAHTDRASKHWQIAAKASTNICYSWQTISSFNWNIKNALCEPCQIFSRLWAARVNKLHVS